MRHSIRLSRLTNSQLKYLIHHGEVRFEVDKDLLEKKKNFKQQAQGIELKYQAFRNTYMKLNAEFSETMKLLDDRLGNVTKTFKAEGMVKKFKPTMEAIMKQVKLITNSAK